MLLSLAYNSHGMGECNDYVRSSGVFPFQAMRISGTLNADAGHVSLLNHVLL